MEEKAEKDQKIQTKKISIQSSTCHYIAAICFVLAGLMFIFLEKNPPMGLLYTSLGCLSVTLGANAAAKEKKQEGAPEDEKSLSDGQDFQEEKEYERS